MAKFVPDVKTQRWIVISPVRSVRPSKKDKGHVCPFCYGNESMTPPEIIRLGEGEKDKPGWKIRVIPNKFPITDIHEVIIHSSDHDKDITGFEDSHILSLLEVYLGRFKAHLQDGHVMIFCNHGERAGASLDHPHSQVVIIPRQINLDALVREPIMNIVDDDKYFVTYCPDFSQWPYEVWIAPKKENTLFSDIEGEELKDLAVVLQRAVRKLKLKCLEGENPKPFAYNYYIHHDKNWFIRIIPRLVHRAGFELGTGLSVNVVDPTIAAGELKGIRI
jgi:UDPglucose--hexose-1-phosphate uridylyltransferase